ncbi:NAC domain-containing protein 78 [Hordeum vulgare]|nr:NAC domain-containing protein 78 [Hordeum vulgare]
MKVSVVSRSSREVVKGDIELKDTVSFWLVQVVRILSRKLWTPKSKKAVTVERKANPSCGIWFVCKGNLICTSAGSWCRTARPSRTPTGMKKTLVFHSGHTPKGDRNNWVVDDYRLLDNDGPQVSSSCYRSCFSFFILIKPQHPIIEVPKGSVMHAPAPADPALLVLEPIRAEILRVPVNRGSLGASA